MNGAQKTLNFPNMILNGEGETTEPPVWRGKHLKVGVAAPGGLNEGLYASKTLRVGPWWV